MRVVGDDWGRTHGCRNLTFPLKLPLVGGALMEVEIWDGVPQTDGRTGGLMSLLSTRGNETPRRSRPEGLLFRKQLIVPEWDVFLILLHSRGVEAQRWFGKSHWMEAGWISQYRPLARKLDRARPW
jgi:hypothetical protein